MKKELIPWNNKELIPCKKIGFVNLMDWKDGFVMQKIRIRRSCGFAFFRSAWVSGRESGHSDPCLLAKAAICRRVLSASFSRILCT